MDCHYRTSALFLQALDLRLDATIFSPRSQIDRFYKPPLPLKRLLLCRATGPEKGNSRNDLPFIAVKAFSEEACLKFKHLPFPMLQCINSRPHHRISCNVQSGESEKKPNAPETMHDEQTLQLELDKAIKHEDYTHAAKLRDNLQALHEDNQASVLSANTRFYHAFSHGDLVTLQSIWAKEDHVYVVHPGAGRISGYELVMSSWEIICGTYHEFPIQIELKEVEVYARGDVGLVTCIEVVKARGSSWGKQVATNVFEKIDGQWLMCIHHASHVEEE